MPAPAVRYPLVVTRDERILDDLLRLAAAAGVEVQVEADAGAAKQSWHTAPIVIVGADQADAVLQTRPPRREHVSVVGTAPADVGDWRRAVALGAEQVIALPDDEQVAADLLADVFEGPGGARAVVIGCIGGRGGAGASVLAASFALTAARAGRAAMLVDADPRGGGVDVMLGAEHAGGLRWPDLAGTRGRVGGRTLRELLPDPHGLTVLSWDRGDVLAVPAEATRAVVTAARRTWDLVVVDLPRHLRPDDEELLAACDTVLIVVPAEVRAVAAAGRVATSVAVVTADVRIVVRGPAPSGLTGPEIATALALPLAAELEPEPGLVAALERGEPPARAPRSPLATACASLLTELAPDRAAAA